jgi:hypothetical protein
MLRIPHCLDNLLMCTWGASIALLRNLEWTEREADYSPSFTSEFKNTWYSLSHNLSMVSTRDGVNEFVSIHVIPSGSLGPEVYSVSNRNEYQK